MCEQRRGEEGGAEGACSDDSVLLGHTGWFLVRGEVMEPHTIHRFGTGVAARENKEKVLWSHCGEVNAIMIHTSSRVLNGDQPS